MIKRFYVPTSKLEEGMQIDQVIKDRLDRTLIARGSALDAYLIEGLKKRGIHGVYIKTGEEDPEKKPEEETLTPFVRNKIEKYRQKIQEKFIYQRVLKNACPRESSIYITIQTHRNSQTLLQKLQMT